LLALQSQKISICHLFENPVPDKIVPLIDALRDSETPEEADCIAMELAELIKDIPDEVVGQIQFELHATIQLLFHDDVIEKPSITIAYIHTKLVELFGIVDVRFQTLDVNGQQHTLEAIAARYMDVLREIAHRDDEEEPPITSKRSAKNRNNALRKLKHAGLLTLDPEGSFHLTEVGWRFVINC
jgi:hypothetical protein